MSWKSEFSGRCLPRCECGVTVRVLLLVAALHSRRPSTAVLYSHDFIAVSLGSQTLSCPCHLLAHSPDLPQPGARSSVWVSRVSGRHPAVYRSVCWWGLDQKQNLELQRGAYRSRLSAELWDSHVDSALLRAALKVFIGKAVCQGGCDRSSSH